MANFFEQYQDQPATNYFQQFQGSPPDAAPPSFSHRLLDYWNNAWADATRGPTGKTGLAGIGESIGPAGAFLLTPRRSTPLTL
jgi:hypothetical protein